MKKISLIGIFCVSALFLSGCVTNNQSTEPATDSSTSEESGSTYENCNSILEARLGADDDAFVIKGVVAQFTYGYSGAEAFYLVDETGSILIYAPSFAKNLQVGYTVGVNGVIDHYQSEQESSVGQEIGYYGALQIVAENVDILSQEITNIPLDSVQETRIKYISETDFRTEDLSSRIFKTKATIVEAKETGYTNYYFYDLSMDQSVYCYSKMSGSDFEYLAEYNQQSREVLIAVHSMRPRDEAWRIIPIAILDEVSASDDDIATFALDRLEDQFLETYTASTSIELVNQDSKLLDEATISYTSDSQTQTINIVDGTYTLNIDINSPETFTVTISLVYKGTTYLRDVKITVSDWVDYNPLTIQEVKEAEEGETVIVEGIYVKFAANCSGLYITDSTGILVVYYSSLNIGDYIEGELMTFEGTVTRDFVIDGVYEGHNRLANATLLQHDSEVHEWDKSIVTGNSSISEIYNNFTVDMIGKIYLIEAYVELFDAGYYTNMRIYDADTGEYMSLYCSNASQLSWLNEYDGITQNYYLYIRDSKSGSSARIEIIDIAD